jgi:hypothetical protein
MFRILSFASLCLIAGLCLSFYNYDTKKPKWKSLFDGKTTAGWHMYGKDYVGNCWQVENGELHLTPVREAQQRGDLVTNEEYENFRLQLDWKVAPKTNSGIIFLVHEDTAQYRQTYLTGLEMQIIDNIDGEDNKKENHLAGTLYDLMGTAADSKVKAVGQWNTAEVYVNKGKLELSLNGHKVAATTLWDDNWKNMVTNSKFKTMPGFAAFKKGKIALQYHGGELWFRNIRIQDLD